MEANIEKQDPAHHFDKKNGFWAFIILLIILSLIIYTAISRIAIDRKLQAPIALSNSRALALSAESSVRKTQSQSAKSLSIMALSKSLANSRAIRTLAQSYAQESENDKALQLFKIGGALSWRDSETQLALFETALKNSDIKSGLDNMDALLRRNVAPDEILAIYILGGQDDNIAKSIAEKLAQNPSWRERFFIFNKWDGAKNMDSYEQVITHLKKYSLPANINEINDYIMNVIAKKSPARGLRFWNEQFPQYPTVLTNSSKVSLSWPHSNRSDKPYVSDWKISNIEDIFPYFEDIDGTTSSTASFDMKKRANGLIATRAIILPRSNINLTIKSPNDKREVSSSLRWIVKCFDNPEEMILDTIPLQDKSWSANISNLPCDTHILQLHVNPAGLSKDIEIKIESVTVSSA